MKIGILGDSHGDLAAMRVVIEDLMGRGVERFIHTGDLNGQHLALELEGAKLFHNLPVVLALTKDQVEEGKEEYLTFTDFGPTKEQDVKKSLLPPIGWTFTRPGHRICRLGRCEKFYVGHALSWDFLTGSEAKLEQKLAEIRRDNDGVRWLISGHTHHQIFKQGLVNFVNPGAIETSFDGYEFALIDTDTGEIVSSRVPMTKAVTPPFSVGVISDSFNISNLDPDFWRKLAVEFKKRDVSRIIHCGNIALGDIGREELNGFEVYYNLRPDQRCDKIFSNWKPINPENPVVDIEEYRFYVQYDLGMDLLDQSEVDMHMLCLNLRRKHPGITFVLCGFTNDAFLEEGQEVRIVNPGDALKDRNFTVICLPRTEITLGHVPIDPLL